MPTDTQTAKLLTAVATMTDEITSLKREVTTLTNKVDETKEIIEAWAAVKTMGKFLKWVGGLVSGVIALWLMMKVGLLHMGGKP